MTANFLRYANLASNLQPPISEDDLRVISALTSPYPIHVQKSVKGCNLKNTQDALNYLSKMEALDSQPTLDKGQIITGPAGLQPTTTTLPSHLAK